MPESKSDAEERARRIGISEAQVVKGENGYFIAPRGIETPEGKGAYAGCRSESKSESQEEKAKCAKIAWSVEKKGK